MDSSLFIQTDDFLLRCAVDSSDALYRVELESRDPRYEKVKPALALLQDQKVANVLALGASDLKGGGDMAFERALYALRILIKRFQGSDIYAVQTTGADLSELVCRCKFLDRKGLQDAFLEAGGDFKKGLLATNASMICSSCALDVKAVYESMTFKELEEKRAQVKVGVEEALKEFSMVCPPNYEDLSFEVASVKEDKLKIRAIGDRKGLGRQQIKKTLENFLGEKTLMGFEISIFF